MRAAPPHRFALHRRLRVSCAPLLIIASLCIVACACHARRSSSGSLGTSMLELAKTPNACK
jgi:hypothetical protein